jgi:hypothetical protein
LHTEVASLTIDLHCRLVADNMINRHIYSALTAGFSNTTCSLENLELRECPTLESNIYRTWYVVGVAEIVGK